MKPAKPLMAAVGVAVSACLVDPTRIVVATLGLRRLRKHNPELFDGSLALAAIERAIEEDGE